MVTTINTKIKFNLEKCVLRNEKAVVSALITFPNENFFLVRYSSFCLYLLLTLNS